MKNKKELKDYIKVYDLVPQQISEEILSDVKDVVWEKHNFYSPRKGTTYNEIEPMAYYKPIYSHNNVMKYFWEAINQYVSQDLKVPYFVGWEGHSYPKYIKYETGHNMKLHCDHTHELFDGKRKGIPILTVIMALNNDYEGGELHILDEDIKLKQGSIIVFPSNFLYPHKVNTITKGTRYTAISWVW